MFISQTFTFCHLKIDGFGLALALWAVNEEKNEIAICERYKVEISFALKVYFCYIIISIKKVQC